MLWLRTHRLSLLMMTLAVALTACNNSSPDSPSTTTPTPTINTFSGTWRSATTTTVVAGACSSMNWSITPTGPNTAAITYSATCGGVPVNGTGTGTLNGTTMNWTTTGTA